MTAELKPCPFCGCTTITQHMTHGIVFHACDWCGAEGPAEQTDDDQLPTGWNDRADLIPAAALAVPEVAALVEAVSRFERLMQTQLRTADYHGEGCKCIRCAEDAMFAALAALRREGRG